MNDKTDFSGTPSSITRIGFRAASLSLFLAVALLSEAVAAVPPGSVRIAVDKKRFVTGKPPALLFLPITAPALAAAGFTSLADYATRTVFEGPASAADGLRASLQLAGHTSNIASDLDRVGFHGFQIDPERPSKVQPNHCALTCSP
jgi:hypothetical protein